MYGAEMLFTPTEKRDVPLTIALREGIQRREKEGFLMKGGVEGSVRATLKPSLFHSSCRTLECFKILSLS